MKMAIFALLMIAATAFAGPYTEYCLEQSDPCFKSNCYKVNGNWELNPDTGKQDCMYDTKKYSDTEMSVAFADCIAEKDQCEVDMANGGTNGSSSSASCCGSMLAILGVGGAAAYIRQKR